LLTFVNEFKNTNGLVKLPNGYYLIRKVVKDDFEIVGLHLIKSNYEFENKYLHNTFFEDYDLPDDFEIVEKRSKFGKILVKFKTLIWKSLKFYTYRMWSQQNYVNSLLLSALETVEQNHRIQIETLEKRIEKLEKKLK
jgi:hypothetical protein